MKVTKEQICQTAVAMFRQAGFAEVSVEDICRRCDVTRGSFYHHFKNKDDLLLFWFDSHAARMYHLLDGTEPGGARQQLLRYLETYAKDISSLGCHLLYHTMLADGSQKRGTFMSPTAGGQYPRVLEAAVGLVAKAQREGSITSEIPASQLMLHYTWGVTGLIFQWRLCDGAMDFMAKVHGLMATVFR